MRAVHFFLFALVLNALWDGATSPAAWARPEYAVREKLNCTACHVTPWGGGPRNLTGKAFGAHDRPLGKLSATDLVYGDLRFIGYYPTKRVTKRISGAALMEAAVSGNAPVYQGEHGEELRALLTYNMPSLGTPGPREAYLRWQLGAGDPQAPTHLVVGRFYVPFGLLTDEHRTYTRLQTNMTINNFAVGAAVAGNLLPQLHLDLAVANDFQSNGALTNEAFTLGGVVNARWNPQALPFFIGASGNYERVSSQPQPWAFSTYGALSIQRLTSGKLPVDLLFERVDARNWNNAAVNRGGVNPGLPNFFFPSGDTTDIQRDRSLGYYGWLRYNISPQFNFFYKYDYLNPSANRLKDSFSRHGFGFETYFAGNVVVNARYEKAYAGRTDIKQTDVLAVQDAAFLMLRFWL